MLLLFGMLCVCTTAWFLGFSLARIIFCARPSFISPYITFAFTSGLLPYILKQQDQDDQDVREPRGGGGESHVGFANPKITSISSHRHYNTTRAIKYKE
jgi:hypothetical protein